MTQLPQKLVHCQRHWGKKGLEAVPLKSLTQREHSNDYFVIGIIHRASSCHISCDSRGLFSCTRPRLVARLDYNLPTPVSGSHLLFPALSGADMWRLVSGPYISTPPSTISFLNRHLSYVYPPLKVGLQIIQTFQGEQHRTHAWPMAGAQQSLAEERPHQMRVAPIAPRTVSLLREWLSTMEVC